MNVRVSVGFALACGLLACACSASDRPPTQQEGSPAVSSTAEVLARHQQTFGASDVPGVLADYAPDAIMFTPNGTVKGTEALRSTFETLFAEWSKPGLTFEMKEQVVDGPYAYMFWNAETADNVYEAGTDSLVVSNGKIVAHFFSAKITPKH
jgi:ketosteroid isomerase-like protein